MTATPATTSLPGRPPVVDLDTWQAARDELLVREKAHTREGDAIAAARRQLPMVEIDGTVEVTGADGAMPFIDLFQGRDVLVAHKHMWHDGIAFDGQCMGCTVNTWHIQRAAVYLNAGGVSFAVLTEGPWDEVARFVEFMGYTEPWYSVRGLDGQVGDDMGAITCFLRDGDRVFLTYRTTGRGNEPAAGVFGLLDMTPYGRGEAWEETPDGWPEGHNPCWYWRSDADGVATWGPTSRPVPQWTRPGAFSLVADTRWVSFRPRPLAMSAEIDLAAGADPGALRHDLDGASALSCTLGDPSWEGATARAIALTHAAVGEHDEAAPDQRLIERCPARST